jgi:hypothetical protein
MPQNPYFYDQLALWLVAWNGRTALLLTLLSWVAYIGTKANCTDVYFCGAEAEPWVQWLLYVPATALALARDVQRPWLTWLGRAPGAQTPPDQIGSQRLGKERTCRSDRRPRSPCPRYGERSTPVREVAPRPSSD